MIALWDTRIPRRASCQTNLNLSHLPRRLPGCCVRALVWRTLRTEYEMAPLGGQEKENSGNQFDRTLSRAHDAPLFVQLPRKPLMSLLVHDSAPVRSNIVALPMACAAISHSLKTLGRVPSPWTSTLYGYLPSYYLPHLRYGVAVF